MQPITDIIGQAVQSRRGTPATITGFGELTENTQETQAERQGYPTQEQSYRCLLCLDGGVIPFFIRKALKGGMYTYRHNLRCRCAKGDEHPQTQTYEENFGRWPTIAEADALRATKTGYADVATAT